MADTQNEKPAEVVQNANTVCMALIRSAWAGNPEAVRGVVELAACLSDEVSNLACLHPKQVDVIATTRTSWPIKCDQHPEMLKRNLRWLKILPLGASSAWKPITRKKYSISSGANAIIGLEMGSISTLRQLSRLAPPKTQSATISRGLSLPDFDGSAAVADQWFEAAWENLCERHNGKPERDRKLRQLGLAHAESHILNAPRAKPSYEQNVRQGVRDSLKAAFKRMFVSDRTKLLAPNKLGS